MAVSPIVEWILATSATTVVLAAAAWFCRGLIGAWLSSSVQHVYDAKLETLRAELRYKEQVSDLGLRAREAEITALRNNASLNINNRNALLIQKKIQATDQVWDAIIKLDNLYSAVAWMSVTDFEKVSDSIESNKMLSYFFRTLPGSISLDDAKETLSIESVRPYVSEYVWGMYSAYRTAIVVENAKLQALRDGLDVRRFVNFRSAYEALKLAMPDYAEKIESQGAASYMEVLPLLKQKILEALRYGLAGREDDAQTIANTAEIIKATNEAQAKPGGLAPDAT